VNETLEDSEKKAMSHSHLISATLHLPIILINDSFTAKRLIITIFLMLYIALNFVITTATNTVHILGYPADLKQAASSHCCAGVAR
jgi:hypothetical protein